MTVKSESIKSDSVKRASSTASKISEVLSYRSDTNKSRTNKLTTAEKSPNNIDSYVYSNTFEELTKSNKYSSLKEKRSEEDSWTGNGFDFFDRENNWKTFFIGNFPVTFPSQSFYDPRIMSRTLRCDGGLTR